MAKMGNKDFSGINTQDIYSKAIEEATQETPEAQEAQEPPKKRKERVTYNEQEAADFLQDMKTTGRKGLHLPRINIAFSPDMYDYVRTMSKAAGMTYTEFINKIIAEHKKTHEDIYQRAIDIRNSL